MKIRFIHFGCFLTLWGCLGTAQAQVVSNVWPDTTINNPYWDQTGSDYDAWAKNNPDVTGDYVWYYSYATVPDGSPFTDPADNLPYGAEPWVDAVNPEGNEGSISSIGHLRHVGSYCYEASFTVTIPKLWAPENRSATPIPGFPFYQVSYELEGKLTFGGSWCWDGTWQANVNSSGVNVKAEFFGGIKARTEYKGYKLDGEVGFKVAASFAVSFACLIKGDGLLWRTGYFSLKGEAKFELTPFLAKIDAPYGTKCELATLTSGVSATLRASNIYHKNSASPTGNYSRGGSVIISNFTTPLTFKFQLPNGGAKVDAKVSYIAKTTTITWGDHSSQAGLHESTEEEIGQLPGQDLTQEMAAEIPVE